MLRDMDYFGIEGFLTCLEHKLRGGKYGVVTL